MSIGICVDHPAASADVVGLAQVLPGRAGLVPESAAYPQLDSGYKVFAHGGLLVRVASAPSDNGSTGNRLERSETLWNKNKVRC